MIAGSFTRYVLLILLVLGCPLSSYAVDIEIPHAENLALTASASAQNGLPVLVFVSRDACPYCRTLRHSVLAPMYAAGKFEQRAILLEVNIDRTAPLVGFDGESILAKDFADLYKASITPTLLFLDAQGNQLSPPRIGISNLDLYTFYLDRSIDESLARLNSPGVK